MIAKSGYRFSEKIMRKALRLNPSCEAHNRGGNPMDPTRRPMRAAGGAALAVAATPHAFGRYPDPAVEVLDPSFAKYRLFNAAVERLPAGMRWGEGPVWVRGGPARVWSGNPRARQGPLITCEHGGRRVVRTEYDGSITVILDKFEGKPLNSPNDVVVRSDHSIWFTDPPFGILGNYEGEQAAPELPTNVYRVDGRTGAATVVTGDINGPNGLCFSPDEGKLYIVESRARPRLISVFDVVEDGTRLANRRVFINAGEGTPDGFP